MTNKVVFNAKKAVVTYEDSIPPFKRHQEGEINVEVSDDGTHLWICKDGASLIRIKKLEF